MKQILIFLDICFGTKELINVMDFTEIIEQKSSEMLLSVPLKALIFNVDHDFTSR